MQEKQESIIIPYLDVEVPVLYDEKSRRHVPAAFFSQLLDLDHSYEMRRVRQILVQYEMSCFFIRQQRPHYTWAFLYPLGLSGWLSTVYGRVRDEAWRAKVKMFVDWGMNQWERVFRQTQERFVQTRTDMYSLAATIAGFEEPMQQVREMAHRFSHEQQVHIQHMDGRWRHLSEQARTFIQEWLAEKNALPVVQAFVVKDDVVDPGSPAISLFATASQEDINILNGYARAISQWMREFKVLLDDFRS